MHNYTRFRRNPQKPRICSRIRKIGVARRHPGDEKCITKIVGETKNKQLKGRQNLPYWFDEK